MTSIIGNCQEKYEFLWFKGGNRSDLELCLDTLGIQRCLYQCLNDHLHMVGLGSRRTLTKLKNRDRVLIVF